MRLAKVAVVGLVAMFSGGGWAQSSHPALTDKHYFSLGIYSQDSDVKLASTRDGRPKRELDLDNLGVDDSYLSGSFAYRWRFAERWALSVIGHRFDVDGSTQLDETIEYDDQEFEAGIRLDTEFSMDALIVDILYSFYKDDRSELQLGLGLHAFGYEVDFQGEAFVGEAGGQAQVAAEELLAPLPNVRLNGTFAISNRWAVYGGVGWLSVNVDDYDGEYTYAEFKTDYRITDRFAAGVGYRIVETDVTYNASSREILFNADFYGPTAFVSYSF